MKSQLFLLFAIIMLLCSACSKHFYAPALYNNDISYQPKPASFDSAKSATYISGGFGANQAVSASDVISFGEINLSEGHVFNNVNLAYGAFGFAGAISNSDHNNENNQPYSFGSKGFWGAGGRASINLYKAMGNVNFRYLGVEGAYSYEDGDFAAYRRLVHDVSGFHSTTRVEMVTLGGTSEILWHNALALDRKYAFRLFVGKTLGDYSYLDNSDNDFVSLNGVYVNVSYFMQVSHFWGAAELTRGIAPVTSIRLKLGYSF